MTTKLHYEFEGFCLDADAGRLLKDGVEVPLNKKAVSILFILVKESGKIVKKDDIIEEVWSDRFVEESNLTQHIYTLRKALGQTSSQVTFIETIAKTGYRFKARVNKVYPNGNGNGNVNGNESVSQKLDVNAAVLQIPAEPNGQLPAIGESQKELLTPVSSRSFVLRLAAILLPACVLAIVGFLVFYGSYSENQTGSQPSKAKSIAVLPFKLLEESDDHEKLGLGMADAVITKLGKLQQIQVRPTSSVFQYASQPQVLPTSAGRSLGVDTILEGAIQREQGRVRVTVQLIDVADGKTLWSDSFNEDFADIFSVQDVIAEKVARALTINLDENQKRLLDQRATNSTEAYKEYMIGTFFWNTRTEDGLRKAIGYFKRAIEIDPNYAYAYALLADSYAMMAYYQYDTSGEMFPMARAAAATAIELDGTVAEAYIALAQVQKHFDHSNEASRRSLEKAIEISPYNATARLRYAWQMVADKNIDIAVSEMRLAQEYNPLSPVINAALCQVLGFRREYKQAAVYCKNAVEIAPDTPLHQISYSDVLFFDGQREAAINMLEQFAQKNRKANYALSRLAFYYTKTGKLKKAEDIYDKMRVEKSSDLRRFIYFAQIAFALDRKDESYSLLKQAAENCAIPFSSDFDPLFADLRSDERHSQIFVNYNCGKTSN